MIMKVDKLVSSEAVNPFRIQLHLFVSASPFWCELSYQEWDDKPMGRIDVGGDSVEGREAKTLSRQLVA